jgi:4'-phosphopantetheinyl transferase
VSPRTSEPLDTGDVLVRIQCLEGEAPDLEEALSVLSASERACAGRFAFQEDKESYVFAHALLRRTLSEMDDSVAPAAWTFDAEPHGKPVLAHHGTRGRIAFNLTHTRGVVACACASRGSVGIDVEAIDRRADYMELAAAYFAPGEIADLRNATDQGRHERFIELWTLKEAYVKAVGRGLGVDLQTFAFSRDDAGLLHFKPPSGDSGRWTFALFALDARYRMALAATSGGRRFTLTASPPFADESALVPLWSA